MPVSGARTCAVRPGAVRKIAGAELSTIIDEMAIIASLFVLPMKRCPTVSNIVSLWEPFGLRSTPFFQEELRSGDQEHPVALFVGRSAELDRLLRRIVSDSSSRSIIQGDPGVGKTSFINRLKANVSARGVATYEHPIRIQSTTTSATLVADVLRLLLRVRLASGFSRDPTGFWSRTARLLEGGEIRGGSVSAFGIGGGVSRSYISPQLSHDSLFEHLGEALERIGGEAGHGVLIHVNNLENLTEEAAEEAAALLRDLRDHLMLPGAHWVFAGAEGVDRIFRRFAQIDGIFPAADTLQPLEATEIETLLARRYKHLSIRGAQIVTPVEPEVASRLYALYHGDLRSFLRLLADAAERGLGLGEVKPLGVEEIIRHTAAEYARHMKARAGATDFEHLTRIVEASRPHYRFRVTDAAKVLGIKQSSASQLVDRLQKSRAIKRERVEGRSVFYRPAGAMLVACGIVPETSEG